MNIRTTMLRAAAFAGAVAIAMSSAFAKDYSQGSKAKEWGLLGEEKALFSGKVVDLLCELAGDCADNCGDGNRNLGIVRADDGKLITVLKNRQPAFNGATEDLLPYCNKDVDVDGTMIGEDENSPSRFYLVQLIRETGTEKWKKTNLWTKRWAQKNPDAKGKGPWFRRDPRVKKQIEAEGHFGLGHAADQKFIEENE